MRPKKIIAIWKVDSYWANQGLTTLPGMKLEKSMPKAQIGPQRVDVWPIFVEYLMEDNKCSSDNTGGVCSLDLHNMHNFIYFNILHSMHVYQY